MNTIFIKLRDFLVALLLTQNINVPVVFSQSPTLIEIDHIYSESNSSLEYEKIAIQIEKFLTTRPDQYEWQWRLARTHYAIAKKLPQNDIHHYELCISYSSRAIALKHDSAISYFYRGLCRGKQGETKGIWASLGIIGPFKEDMEKAVSLDPTVSHAGPHRALGKLYLELPFILGGDLGKSTFHLQEAVRLAPDYAENYLGLAQVLIKNNNSIEARETLNKLMQLTDNTLDDKLLSLRKKGISLLEEITP
ncbi:MAG: tetratricopeptide repeat protein [Nitrospinota bacterium]|nr:tetratricopeptide repeat protein [Nitrospinota bacterium]